MNNESGKVSSEVEALVEMVQEAEKPSSDEGSGEESVTLFTQEAFDWMKDPNSIPGAYAPILYCGLPVAYNIFTKLGRPITLAEATVMVAADGPLTACMLSGDTFQPVRYVYRCPEDFDGNFENLPMGGQHYLIRGEIQAVSGSIYRYDGHQDEYVFCKSSPYFVFVDESRKVSGTFKWGKTHEKVKEMLESKKLYKERSQAIKGIAAKLAREMF